MHACGGRPRGGKAPASVRKYWRDQKRKQAAKKRREKAAKKRRRKRNR